MYVWKYAGNLIQKWLCRGQVRSYCNQATPPLLGCHTTSPTFCLLREGGTLLGYTSPANERMLETSAVQKSRTRIWSAQPWRSRGTRTSRGSWPTTIGESHIRCGFTLTRGASAVNWLIRWGQDRSDGRGDAQPAPCPPLQPRPGAPRRLPAASSTGQVPGRPIVQPGPPVPERVAPLTVATAMSAWHRGARSTAS